MGAREERQTIMRAKFVQLLKGGDGLGVHTFLFVRLTEVLVNRGKPPIHLYGLTRLLDGLVILASQIEDSSCNCIHGERERIEIQRAFDLCDRLLVSP